jgi:citrate synthase
MTTQIDVPRGLAGVVVDETRISEIDGERGLLSYRGHPFERLVDRPFLEVASLVVGKAAIDADRRLPREVVAVLANLPRTTHVMTVLQMVMPLLGDEIFAIAARVPTAVASWIIGKEAEPDMTLPIHADFLRMIRAAAPSAAEVKLLDVTQILQLEHGFNASTFTARVVASTLAPLATALSAAVGALYGPLHGGADEAAYRMALAIGAPANVPAWVDGALARKEKIMGLGHREYRVVDPRAKLLRKLATGGVLETLVAVDDYASAHFAKEGKTIRANVEFYKGAVFASLGIEPAYFTALFVMARVYGWGAHVLELWTDNKLYRPAARYVGPKVANM